MNESNNKGSIIFLILLIVIIGLDNTSHIFNIDKSVYNRNAQFEYHHLYPQEHFSNSQNEINMVTLRLRNFEHMRWIHSKSNFDRDWNKAVKEIPFIFSIFGGKHNQLVKDGSIRLYPKRNAAYIAGANVISYQWLVYDYSKKKVSLPKPMLAMNIDAISNLIYNISYITSIPYKFIKFSLVCINGISEFGLIVSFKMFLWMLVHLIFGFISSVSMLVFGFFIGLIFHPLETLGNFTISLNSPTMNNIIVSIIDLIGAIIKPLFSIFK